MRTAPSITYRPSRVEGIEGVSSVTIYPDRLELDATNGVVCLRFIDMARWPSPRWYWRLIWRLRLPLRMRRFSFLCTDVVVGDRDWFHDGPDMYFRFDAEPPITIYMPDDETKESYGETHFVRTQEIMSKGRFMTFDLG
ncbi:MAG: hypothetical protein AAF432_04910 [Planctomycetota bacterium]